MDNKNFPGLLRRGVTGNNPSVMLTLGLCPILAVSTSLENALVMGALFIFVLLCSTVIINLAGRFLPEEIQSPSYLIIISIFVIAGDYLAQLCAPDVRSRLGIFVPLLALNCILLGKAQLAAGAGGLPGSLSEALGAAFGFSIALTGVSFLRELLGQGSVAGFRLFDNASLFVASPAGAFLTVGFVLAAINYWRGKTNDN